MKELTGKQYLQRRGEGWYFRYAVPHALRDLLGKREIREPLGTTSLEEAKQGRNLRLKHKSLREMYHYSDKVTLSQ